MFLYLEFCTPCYKNRSRHPRDISFIFIIFIWSRLFRRDMRMYILEYVHEIIFYLLTTFNSGFIPMKSPMPSSHSWQLYLYWAMALLFILLDCKSLHFRKYMFNTLWHFPNLIIIFKDTLVMVHLMIFYTHSNINNTSFLISLFCDSFRLNIVCYVFIL